MTTRLKVGEYEAWLVVENAEVEHYKIEVDEQTQIATCWIASTAGKVRVISIYCPSKLIDFSTSEFV
jgi:uncharacterized protein involved in high-affinity Fe2+ transport